jgi:hypothetical protein
MNFYRIAIAVRGSAPFGSDRSISDCLEESENFHPCLANGILEQVHPRVS